jgi:hypothetical protein
MGGGGVLKLSGFLSWRKALTFSNNWLLLLLGDYPIRQLVLWEKDFGWMIVWELKSEVLGSLRLMASAIWGLKASMIGESVPCPF